MGIAYHRVPKSSRLLLDYIYNFDQVADFFTASPFSLSSYQELAEILEGLETPRRKLADILARQNRSFGSQSTVFENIERLKQKGTFAVVTGQQVGLFSGPAFTLYKALTAVRVAQWLSENGLPSVPVFWLATEDHDLEEVAQTAVLNEDYELVRFADQGERPSPRSPVGSVQLTSAITETLDRLERTLPAGGSRDSMMSDLRDFYSPGATWTESFARLMARLFGRWGVILVDSLDRELHQLSVRAYATALDRTAAARQLLLERSQRLESKRYHAQVHLTDDSTLLFVMRDGDRLPLRQNNSDFLLGDNETLSLADLNAWLEKDPLQFSANVLMRPVVQDSLLPTIAYVAGPSEIAYLGQAQALYETFGRPMPVVFPRASFTLVDARAQRFLDKYRLSVDDVWQGEEHLGRQIAMAGYAEGWAGRFDQSGQELSSLLERLQKDVETLDPTLLDTLKNVEEKMHYQMERLRGKLTRAALQRSELLSRHQQSLLQFLYPGKDLQERQVCGVYFLSRAGYDLLERILSEIQVDSSDHQILNY